MKRLLDYASLEPRTFITVRPICCGFMLILLFMLILSV